MIDSPNNGSTNTIHVLLGNGDVRSSSRRLIQLLRELCRPWRLAISMAMASWISQ